MKSFCYSETKNEKLAPWYKENTIYVYTVSVPKLLFHSLNGTGSGPVKGQLF